MKRIGVLQIWQESNHFNPVPTAQSDFENFRYAVGYDSVPEYLRQGREEIGGFVDGLAMWNEPTETVGLLIAQAWPSGPLSAAARQWLLESVRREVSAAGSLDGLLVSLHGALIAADDLNCDASLISAIRGASRVPDLPLVCSLDLHGHLTVALFAQVDGLVAYQSNPHVDRYETGLRAAALLGQILGGAKPTTCCIRLPMIAPGEATTTDGCALRPVFARLREIEQIPHVLAAAVFATQPYLDLPDLGWTCLVATNNNPAEAQTFAATLADLCWAGRTHISDHLHHPDSDQAVGIALKLDGSPIVIADGGDATNSGAGGDSTHLLGALLRQPIHGGALSIMVDPQAVEYAANAGPGSRFEFSLGGKRDNRFCAPLSVHGTVLSVQPARYELQGHLGDRLAIDMGMGAVVQLGDVTLLLVQRPGPGSSPQMYRCVGLEPRKFKLVVVKSPAGFRLEFEPFAAGIVLTACRGCADSRLRRLPYSRISRPLWPLDDIDSWSSVEWSSKASVRLSSKSNPLRSRRSADDIGSGE